MKRRIFILVLSLLILCSATAFADQGTISLICRQSRNVLLVTSYGAYSCGQITIMSPTWMLHRGDVIVGEFNAYGEQQFYNVTTDTAFSVWIDNFYLDINGALAWLEDNT